MGKYVLLLLVLECCGGCVVLGCGCWHWSVVVLVLFLVVVLGCGCCVVLGCGCGVFLAQFFLQPIIELI